jgi:hypothetical protein
MLAAMHGQSSGDVSLALSAAGSLLGTFGARLLQACVIALLLVHGAAAQEKDNAVERTAKKATAATERGVKRAANATERGVKSAAKGVERGAKATDKALTNAAKKTDNWVKEKTK